MKQSGLPTLNSLRAFAVLAKTGSYSRAGASLNVSHAAVNQQVRALEANLGAALVMRDGRGIKLTEDGAVLARHVALGLASIRDGVEAVTGAGAARPVQVTMPPAFAVSWLMPRIMDFQHRHPGVTLMLNATAELLDLAPGGLDLAIRFGDGNWPGMNVAPFLHPDLVVVATRSFASGKAAKTPARLAELPWLQELGTEDVAKWMARHRVKPRRAVRITHMPGNLIMDAVRRGDGLTYTARCFVDEDIRAGRLVEFSSERDTGAYYIVIRPGVPRPPVRKFITWLKRQAPSGAATGA
jgi:LysR family glycine cleavage system transcriptional activator